MEVLITFALLIWVTKSLVQLNPQFVDLSTGRISRTRFIPIEKLGFPYCNCNLYINSKQKKNPSCALQATEEKMATVPGQLIWEIVKKNNSFLVKEFGNNTQSVQFSRESNNLYNLNSFKYSGMSPFFLLLKFWWGFWIFYNGYLKKINLF